MIKNILIGTVALLTCTGVFAEEKETTEKADSGFVFTDTKLVPTTSVKDQNKSGTCWSFSSTSFFEDEILRKTGKELDLSEMFTVRHCYADKAEKYIRMNGKLNFAQGGSCLDMPYVWDRYGIVPESVYAGLEYGEKKHSHYELEAALTGYLDGINKIPNKRPSTAWLKGFNAILDAYFGVLPETFEVDGKTYTPVTYAKSLGLDMADYVPLTSFTHHPFYKQFGLEVADNWLWGQYYNIPLDELKAIVDNAIENGYTVLWAADVSEGGFKWNEGFAVMPKERTEADMEGTELARWVKMSDKDRAKKQFEINGPVQEIEVTQESRQEMFDRQETTDDHGMEIIGTATDQKGNKYYKVKNSWDTNQIYDGFFYVSEPYLLAKTINIIVNKEAIPKATLKKLNL